MEEHGSLKTDFRNFLFYAFSHLGLGSPTRVQYDIATYLQHGGKRSVIQSFRGVGKTWITALYAVWRVWNNPNIKVLIVSGSGSHSDKVARFTRSLFDLLPVLNELAPKAGDKDHANSFDVHSIPPAVQPTFSSIGLTGQLQGNRANLLIADDVETQMNSYTIHQREKLWDIVKEFDSILNSDEDTGYVNRIVYLGTPQCTETLYNTLINERGYEARIWPARYPSIGEISKTYRGLLAPLLAEELRGDEMLKGKPTDPERFTDEDLLERELSNGRSGFARQYMLNTELGDAERFPLKLRDLIVTTVDPLRAPTYMTWCNDMRWALDSAVSPGLDGDRFYRPYKISDDWEEYTGSVMAVDPAGRGKDEVGYAVVKHLLGHLFVTACGGRKGGYEDDNMKFLATLAKEQKVNVITVESNFGSGMFAANLRQWLLKVGHQCKVEDEHATGQKEKRIIDTLEPVMNQHKLVVHDEIVRKDLETEGQDYRLFYQMTRLTEERGCLKHDDRLDALAAAVSYWADNMAQDNRMEAEEWKMEQLRRQLEDLDEHLANLGIDKAPKKLLWNCCHKS